MRKKKKNAKEKSAKNQKSRAYQLLHPFAIPSNITLCDHLIFTQHFHGIVIIAGAGRKPRTLYSLVVLQLLRLIKILRCRKKIRASSDARSVRYLYIINTINVYIFGNIYYTSLRVRRSATKFRLFSLSVFSEDRGLKIGVSPMRIKRAVPSRDSLGLDHFCYPTSLFVSMFLRFVNSIP